MLRTATYTLAFLLLPSVALGNPAKQWDQECFACAKSVMQTAFVPLPIVMPDPLSLSRYPSLNNLAYQNELARAKAERGRLIGDIGKQAYRQCFSARQTEYVNRQIIEYNKRIAEYNRQLQKKK